MVFDDADLDQAVIGALISKYRNMGQTCVCANRILVQDKVYASFSEKLVQAVKKFKLGNGLEADVTQGPLINPAAVEKVEEHIADAVKHGAKIILGGKPHALGGTFFEPTILIDVTEKMKIAHEETFGPVAALFRFQSVEAGITLANNTQYGLASYFYSQGLARVFEVAEKLDYGMVGVNTGLVSNAAAPFGGIKESGMGREGSKYGMDEFVEIKYICLGGLND